MAADPDNLASSFDTRDSGGLLSGLLAEEDLFDRRILWRLGSWGAASVGALVVALLANQSSLALRRDEIAAIDLATKAQQIQLLARESQNETRRLASAVDTLSGDRDRLYSRVTVLEQGLDSVTGAISRQNTPAAASPAPASSGAATAAVEPQPQPQSAPAPVVSPVASTNTRTNETAAAKPAANNAAPDPTPADAAAGKLIEPAAKASADAAASAPAREALASASAGEPDAPQAASDAIVQRTEFGIDVGGANSIGGLRALWRGLLKSSPGLTALRPVIAIKEGTGGLGLQLRLVAGPIGDAAAAAKFCARLIESERACTTTLFDGQRLAMKADDAVTPVKPATRPLPPRRGGPKRAEEEEPARKPEPSTLSTFFGRR